MSDLDAREMYIELLDRFENAIGRRDQMERERDEAQAHLREARREVTRLGIERVSRDHYTASLERQLEAVTGKPAGEIPAAPPAPPPDPPLSASAVTTRTDPDAEIPF